eukprot:445386-Rhodomonas_salina.2
MGVRYQGKSPSSIESKVVCLWALDGSAAVEVNAPFVSALQCPVCKCPVCQYRSPVLRCPLLPRAP